MSRLLIVDDDKALTRSLEIHLSAQGHQVRSAHSLADAWELFSSSPGDVVFLDLKLPDGDSRELLRSMRARSPGTQIIVITGHQDMQATIEAIRLGAFDYIRKPLDLNQILESLDQARRRIPADSQRVSDSLLPSELPGSREIVGRSAGIVQILKQIAVLSQSRVTVLIEGETGTGKELVARALHDASGPSGPFVAVNCGGIVPTLLESELFGHERGSFTGAASQKLGRMELAGEGSLFFDEIGDLPKDLQAKLLRALQEAEFERVGGLDAIPLKARIMAATHRDLAGMVEDGTFRHDLYYRLAVARVRIPSLRDRTEDIPLIAEFLLNRIARQLRKAPVRLAQDAEKRLREHSWPGNVRELENVLTRAAAWVRDDLIGPEDLRIDPVPGGSIRATIPIADEIRPLREMERQYIADVLTRLNWNITRSAEALEISPTTLRKKILDFGLEAEQANRRLPPVG